VILSENRLPLFRIMLESLFQDFGEQDFGGTVCFAVIHRAFDLALIPPTARHEPSES
jgi:hypothetical protein